MPDKMRAPVEKYKLGPEENRFVKRFKDMLRAETMLQLIGQRASVEMQNILSLYGEVKQEKQRLLAIPPMVNEIPGQNFEGGEEPMSSQEIQGQPEKWRMNY